MSAPNSEIICKKAGINFFFRDHVFEDLNSVYNSKRKKVELCDALFEYNRFYIVIQIKERKANSLKLDKEKAWMDKVVYTEAVNQINTSLDYIKNIDITVNDCFNQKVTLNKNNIFQIYW